MPVTADRLPEFEKFMVPEKSAKAAAENKSKKIADALIALISITESLGIKSCIS